MRKTAILCAVLAVVISAQTAFAAEIPIESTPENATAESVTITQNLIGSILDEVKGGLGFQPAWCKANNAVFNAVLANQTGGYGYADLAAISRNAILWYRDIYLRPEYYAQKETQVKTLIADLIAEVENGTTDYDTAKKEAYIRIYQSVNSSYTPSTEIGVDRIYLDIPAADSVMFTQARKLLKGALPK
mgnify:CR=1 FL=1